MKKGEKNEVFIYVTTSYGLDYNYLLGLSVGN